MGSRSRENFELGPFSRPVLFSSEQQKYVSKCITYVESDCFSALPYVFCTTAMRFQERIEQ